MLNKYDRYHKEYIRLSKRQDEINKERRNQPWIYVTPFQKGWETSIILRDDIANRNDANFILHLIDIGYREHKLIRKLEHVRLIRRGIYIHKWKSKYDDKIHTESFIPDKVSFSEKQYEKLSDREKRWFYRDRYSVWYDKRKLYYLNIPNYWIRLKVKPCIYDRIMDKNGDLESEYEKISDKLHKPPFRKFYYRGSSWNRLSKIHNEIQIGKMKLQEGLDEYYLGEIK